MIQYLKNNEIDIEKYDNCIKSSRNSRIYAFSWYLNIVADNWDVLVLNDYEAVMPLPFLKRKRNFFLNKIDQPPFCQQLGIFSNFEIYKEQFEFFILSFLNMKPRSYNFNAFNFDTIDVIKNKINGKINFELSLIDTYDFIKENYSKNLKRNISKAKKSDLKVIKGVSLQNLISLKKVSVNHKIPIRNLNKLEKLIQELTSRNLGFIYGTYLKEELVSASFLINYNKRLIHLFSANTEKGKIYGGISLLFDTIIQEHITENEIFDFEGSMIPGVAKFFRSFGAKQINYFSFKN